MAGGETRAQWIYPGEGGGRGQTGSVRELRPDGAFALTASPEDEKAMRASVGEIGGGECDRVTGTGDRTGASRPSRKGEPALDDEVLSVWGKTEDLVDPTPCPVIQATKKAPELPRSSGCRVPRPGLWDRGKGGKGEFRE